MVATGELLAGRYRVGALLGRGGMAEVHRGEDLGSGEPVAVKVLRGVDADGARRLAGEQRVLSRLHHPGLVGLRDSGTWRGDPFLVLDLVEGCDLAGLLRQGALGIDAASGLLLPVAEGLAHAHAAGVVHRDVKPANVLVDAEGRGRLADFGIARVAGMARHTATGRVVGTAVYLAPEQVRGEQVGSAADVYALGLVLLECATGVRAFPGAAVESAMARLARTPTLPPWLPPWLRRLLEGMTAMDPQLRPTAAEVADALRDGLADRPGALAADPDQTAVLVTAVQPPPRGGDEPPVTELLPDPIGRAVVSGKSRVAWLAALAAALLVVTGALVAAGQNRGSTPAESVPATSIPTMIEPPSNTTVSSTTSTVASRVSVTTATTQSNSRNADRKSRRPPKSDAQPSYGQSDSGQGQSED
jgi:serine/threonine protein kinase